MDETVTFAHMSDTHVAPDAVEHNQLVLDQLTDICASGVDFIIHTGDVMDEPSGWAARTWKAISSRVRVPIFCVPGNHDVHNPPMVDGEAPWWARLTVSSQRVADYCRWLGPSWYAFSHRRLRCIALNSLLFNSGLDEELQQWAWLEAEMAAGAWGARPAALVVLFMHMPLFVHTLDEELDDANFLNRYFVVAPPARERLLGLIRRHRVELVLSGHLHAPMERCHSWPEGFTTRFVTTGAAGCPSSLAAEHFDLQPLTHAPITPEMGIGYYRHDIHSTGIVSVYRPTGQEAVHGSWRLGKAWSACCTAGDAPQDQDGIPWHAPDHQPDGAQWRELGVSARLALARQPDTTYHIRQTIECASATMAMALEISTERGVQVYLNGDLLYDIEPLTHRPPAWTSAGGSVTIDTPRMRLGLDQSLVRPGKNILALRVAGDGSGQPGDYVAFLRKSSGPGGSAPAQASSSSLSRHGRPTSSGQASALTGAEVTPVKHRRMARHSLR